MNGQGGMGNLQASCGEWYKSTAWVEGTSLRKVEKFENEVEPALKELFDSVVFPLSGPRPSRFTRQKSGIQI
jgi:hypothetical protein